MQVAHLSLVEKASILTETLPWLETYAGKTVAVSYTHLTLPTTPYV